MTRNNQTILNNQTVISQKFERAMTQRTKIQYVRSRYVGKGGRCKFLIFSAINSDAVLFLFTLLKKIGDKRGHSKYVYS